MAAGARVSRSPPSRPLRDAAHLCSFAIAAGVSLFYLARLMGSSVDQIDKTYGHLLPDSEEYLRGLLDTFDGVVSISRVDLRG